MLTDAIAQTQLYKTLQGGLGGIRDILLDGTQAGRLIAHGRYDATLADSGTFAAMAGLGARPEPPPGA